MYRTMDVSFWTDRKIKSLSSDAKLLAIYLVTNPHTNVGGIYYLPRVLMALETGLTEPNCNTLCDTLSSIGFASFDTEIDVVWVRKMFFYQGRGEKNERAVANALVGFHKSKLVKEFLQYYPSVERFFSCKPGYPIQSWHSEQEIDIEQEQEIDQEQEKPTATASQALEKIFERFQVRAKETGICVPLELDDERRKKLSTRLKKKGWLEKLGVAFTKLPLKGEWQPTFDWFVANHRNALKVAEGNYDNWKSKSPNGKPPPQETSRTMEEIIADDERREKEQEQQA